MSFFFAYCIRSWEGALSWFCDHGTHSPLMKYRRKQCVPLPGWVSFHLSIWMKALEKGKATIWKHSGSLHHCRWKIHPPIRHTDHVLLTSIHYSSLSLVGPSFRKTSTLSHLWLRHSAQGSQKPVDLQCLHCIIVTYPLVYKLYKSGTFVSIMSVAYGTFNR